MAATATDVPFPEPGELGLVAFIRGGDVWVKPVPDGAEAQLTFDGGYYGPRFSPGGDWLAVQRNPATVLISRTGDRFSVPSADRADWVWSPVGAVLAFMTAVDSSELHLVDPVARSDNVIWRPDSGLALTRIAWSPDATQIAVGMRPQPQAQPITKEQAGELGAGAALLLVDARTGAARELARSRFARGSLIPSDFTPDGAWLVAYESYDVSASLAADGMPLRAIDTASGLVADLYTYALLNDAAIAPGPLAMAIVAGAGREGFANKRLSVASFKSGTRLTATEPPGLPEGVIGAPAWTPSGERLAFARGQALAPGSVTSVTRALVAAQRRIWIHELASGESRELLDDSGLREENPEWSLDGDLILFVRVETPSTASLWLADVDGSRPLVAVLAGVVPAQSPGFAGYYGNVDWELIYDWWQPARPDWMN